MDLYQHFKSLIDPFSFTPEQRGYLLEQARDLPESVLEEMMVVLERDRKKIVAAKSMALRERQKENQLLIQKIDLLTASLDEPHA